MIRQEYILDFIRQRGQARSSEIHEEVIKRGEKASLVTIKRRLSQLEQEGVLLVSGKGPATAYSLSNYGKLTSEVDTAAYCATEPDKRSGAQNYNFELFEALNFDLFSKAEKEKLTAATKFYKTRAKNVSQLIHQKELERFIIELSWKSSRIEGNTYSLLDTEALIQRGTEAPGHNHEEATMILNHKQAFAFIYEHQEKFKTLSRSNIEDVHKLLVADLGVKPNLRSHPVGVTGSRYRPLDNQHQLAEALDKLCLTVAGSADGYVKSLITLGGLSYLQPFEDGNKRTARLMANALLLAHNLAPLSYRSVDEPSYREAMIVFYELNSLIPLKKIFVEQYDFAARNYLLGG